MKCTQPGCTGEIVDGYCDVCGLAPRRAEPSAGPTTMTGSRRRTTNGGTPARRRLGAGLVEIGTAPSRDPEAAVMSVPAVAEQRRFCSRCDAPVGRGRDGAEGRTEGFCRNCGARFSFTPKLTAGELVAGQYEIVGCLAHGGLGWVYLARDHNVSDRWVVLKGLLNSDDADAMAAALAERSFLAQVEHPNIVKIFNFVEHEGSGYIVMEYVGGTSLRDMLKLRREANGGAVDPLPAAQAGAYMLEILPALGHLHRTGLLFCDFKPDNVIQTEHSLKLIDLGGVYRMDDETSPVYGTVGFQAPEVGDTGPSIPSDLFTVARTLAVLCTDFRGYQTTFKYTLPPQDAVPLYARFPSLYGLLLKATAGNPDDRFQSAEEMGDQLFGVLREIVAAEEGTTVAAQSTLFTTALPARADQVGWRLLPVPRVSSDDPAAGYLASLSAADASDRLGLLQQAPERSVEVELQTARALIDDGHWPAVAEHLERVAARDPWDWRVSWYRGVAELAQDRPQDARATFSAVYSAVPGELAPKLAIGMCAELAGSDDAIEFYDVVSRTDPWHATATFGLARCALAMGDHARALDAFDRVPDTSSWYVQAQVAKVRCLLDGGPDVAVLTTAGAVLETLELGAEERTDLTIDLLRSALDLVEDDREVPDGVRLAGHSVTPYGLRIGLESTYRSAARFATTRDDRIRLVDWANRVRPRTWT